MDIPTQGGLPCARRQRMMENCPPKNPSREPALTVEAHMTPAAASPLPSKLQPPSAPTPASVDELFITLYQELRRLARSRLAGGGRHTLLDTSALVHESFLRLQRAGHLELRDREHFLAYAATTMRSVVIDFVRRRSADRRGGGAPHITLNTLAGEQLGATDDEILDVHEALETLAKVDERLVKVVEMRYFIGLTDAEIGAALNVTDRTVRRDWERARLLLAEMLGR
jgi:RNA polymerase sigma factor (TIGR02999 family)